MAEIDVQRSRKAPWGWLLLLALVAVAAWGAWELLDGDGATMADAAPVPMAEPIAPMPSEPLVPTAVVVVDAVRVREAVRAYEAHLHTQVPASEEHLYSARGISRLGTALAALVGREPGPDPDLVAKANAFFLVANLLVASPDSLRLHADWMRNTAVSAVELMRDLSERRYPGIAGMDAELEQALREAHAIDPERGLADQRELVRQFFMEAADPLRALAQRAGESPAGGSGG